MSAASDFERCVAGGGVAVFPADTVYGLACDPEDAAAVERLYALKGRPTGKPSAVMFFDAELALAALPELGARTRALMGRLLPGRGDAAAAQPARALAARRRATGSGCACPTCRRCAASAASVLQSSANAAGAPDARRLEDVPEAIRRAADLVHRRRRAARHALDGDRPAAVRGRGRVERRAGRARSTPTSSRGRWRTPRRAVAACVRRAAAPSSSPPSLVPAAPRTAARLPGPLVALAAGPGAAYAVTSTGSRTDAVPARALRRPLGHARSARSARRRRVRRRRGGVRAGRSRCSAGRPPTASPTSRRAGRAGGGDGPPRARRSTAPGAVRGVPRRGRRRGDRPRRRPDITTLTRTGPALRHTPLDARRRAARARPRPVGHPLRAAGPRRRGARPSR